MLENVNVRVTLTKTQLRTVDAVREAERLQTGVRHGREWAIKQIIDATADQGPVGKLTDYAALCKRIAALEKRFP